MLYAQRNENNTYTSVCLHYFMGADKYFAQNSICLMIRNINTAHVLSTFSTMTEYFVQHTSKKRETLRNVLRSPGFLRHYSTSTWRLSIINVKRVQVWCHILIFEIGFKNLERIFFKLIMILCPSFQLFTSSTNL